MEDDDLEYLSADDGSLCLRCLEEDALAGLLDFDFLLLTAVERKMSGGLEAEAPDWADLTHEALVEIFKRLGFEDRYVTVPQVCKAWFAAVRDAACFEVVDMSELFATRQESRRWWQPDFEEKVDHMVITLVDRTAGCMKELRTSHCSDVAITYVAQRCPRLEVLSIPSSIGVTDSSLKQIATGCLRLHTLDISECLYVSEDSLQHFGDSIMVLKRNMLNVDDNRRRGMLPIPYSQMCHYAQSGDKEAQLFAALMPKLKHLEMRHTKLSDDGLSLLAEHCGDLEYLDLLWSTSLTRRGWLLAKERLKKLKVFLYPNLPQVRPLHLVPRQYGHWQLYNERFENEYLEF